jgi:hypothetical protein
VPAPKSEEPEERFQEIAKLGSSRKLMEAGAGGVQRVPHNWSVLIHVTKTLMCIQGLAPESSRLQNSRLQRANKNAMFASKCVLFPSLFHCDQLYQMIKAKPEEGAQPSGEGGEAGKSSLCDEVDGAYKEMCNGYDDYLKECPSFIHDLCHEDVGGGERLRSPCPDYLKCYYCLRINPIYCF